MYPIVSERSIARKEIIMESACEEIIRLAEKVMNGGEITEE